VFAQISFEASLVCLSGREPPTRCCQFPNKGKCVTSNEQSYFFDSESKMTKLFVFSCLFVERKSISGRSRSKLFLAENEKNNKKGKANRKKINCARADYFPRLFFSCSHFKEGIQMLTVPVWRGFTVTFLGSCDLDFVRRTGIFRRASYIVPWLCRDQRVCFFSKRWSVIWIKKSILKIFLKFVGLFHSWTFDPVDLTPNFISRSRAKKSV